jgi:simple sugar transport system ATP-binding protein
MAELMIGTELRKVERRRSPSRGQEQLVLAGLSIPGVPPFGTDLKDVSLSVRAGEVVGIAGVAGNGQNELARALAGEILAPEAAMIRLGGRPIGRLEPGGRRRAGLCVLPEERNGHAAVPDFSLAENTLLTARHRLPLTSYGFLRLGAARDFARQVIARFDVRTTGPAAFARSLSGGNLQKFVVGREMMQRPDVLAVSQPTWGVDAGAAATIQQAIVDLAARGCAVIVISQDLDELLAIATRLMVMNEGRLSPPLEVEGADVQEIGLLMGGVHGKGDDTAAHEARDAVHA